MYISSFAVISYGECMQENRYTYIHYVYSKIRDVSGNSSSASEVNSSKFTGLPNYAVGVKDISYI